MDESMLPEDDSVFMEFSNDDANISDDLFMEDSFSSVLGSSTPLRRGRGSARSSRGRAGRTSRGRGRGRGASSVPLFSSTSQRLPCNQCSNTYANDKTLAVHLKMHVMKGAASRAANINDIQEKMPALFGSSLSAALQEISVGDLAVDVKSYVSGLQVIISSGSNEVVALLNYLSDSFFNILRNQNAVFPSAVRTAVLVGTNRLLSNKEFRVNVKGHLNKLQEASENVLNAFFGSLMLQLSEKVFVFYLQKMRGAVNSGEVCRRKRSSDDPNSETFQKLVYHIGGSVVHGFLWKGQRRVESSHRWSVFVELIKNKFLKDENGENACSESVRSMTEAKDRGGLKHISQQAFDFFLILFDLLMSIEGSDGSLPPDVVDECVIKNDSVLCLWDVLVGDELGEELSLDLLMQVSHCCKRIVVKGIMKRRLNEHLKKSFSSVSLRARLAR